MKQSIEKDDPILGKIKIGAHAFPGIWQYMLPPEIATLDVPEERRATCMACPKIRDDGFLHDYRCCTYHPRIPNFMLGLALATETGRIGIAKAQEANMLTPEGMAQSPMQYLDYLGNLQGDSFGISTKVLCPMLDRASGFCNVHAFRNGVCSTFFCHNDQGAKGDEFWGKVQGLASQVEMALSQWCMVEIGIPIQEYVDVFAYLAQDMDQVSDKKSRGFSARALKMLWGSYFGRENEFYRRCAELIAAHRDVLWEIANEFTIKDAQVFDIALLKSVPKNLLDQVDEADWEVGGEALKPSEMWDDLRRCYGKLWVLPEKPVKLSASITIQANALATQRDRDYKDHPFILKKKSDRDFALYLSSAEASLLDEFKSSRTIDWQLLTSAKARALTQPKRFLAEVCGQRILIPGRGAKI